MGFGFRNRLGGTPERVDLRLVEMLLEDGSGVSIHNDRGFGRLDVDVREALQEMIYRYEEMLEEREE